MIFTFHDVFSASPVGCLLNPAAATLKQIMDANANAECMHSFDAVAKPASYLQ